MAKDNDYNRKVTTTKTNQITTKAVEMLLAIAAFKNCGLSVIDLKHVWRLWKMDLVPKILAFALGVNFECFYSRYKRVFRQLRLSYSWSSHIPGIDWWMDWTRAHWYACTHARTRARARARAHTHTHTHTLRKTDRQTESHYHIHTVWPIL